MSGSATTLKQKAIHELKEFLLIALYLWVVFGLFVLYKSLILGEEHIDFAYKGLALINALALAKVMLIARALHLGNHIDDAPLIYVTLVKTTLFTLVLAACKALEDGAVGAYHGHSFVESMADAGGGSWSGFLTLTILLFFMLAPFFAFSELGRVLGEGRLRSMFFQQRSHAAEEAQ
jgi:hypothetical protein